MSRNLDPKLLYSVGNILAYEIKDGIERPIPSNGPQTLSLLMVSTASPFDDLSATDPTSAAPEEDFYLHLHLPPDLDLSLPATTQVYRRSPRSYLIPRGDGHHEGGSFLRIEFPPIGSGPGALTQEDVDTFETILAQCTAFQERASSKDSEAGLPSHGPGHIVLVDEENGSIVGELGEGFNVVEGKDVRPGSKQPVEITLPSEEGPPGYNEINVHTANEEYLKLSRHPAYRDSTLVQNAAVASRLIVTGGGWLSKQLSTGADNFVEKTKPNPKPLAFTPTTQARVRKLNTVTGSAAGLSAKTVGQVSRHAQNLGAAMTRRGGSSTAARSSHTMPPDTAKGHHKDRKPGLLNKSMIAFSTVADGVDYAARSILASGSQAATQVVGHKFGDDAKNVAGSLAGGVRNVGLVYIDAAGVSRRAVIKSVAKGMVVGKAPGGGDLVVGGGDGGAIPPEAMPSDKGGVSNDSTGAASGKQVGFGNALPEKKGGGLGEPMGMGY